MPIFVSIVASTEGVNPAAYYPCESYPSDFESAAESAGLDVDSETIDPSESEYDSELWKLSEGDECKSIKVSGILNWGEAFEFLDSIGAIPERCETMGTIGGPLGDWVPDFAFTIESQLQVASIRITPFLADDMGNFRAAPSQEVWERIKRILWEKYSDPWKIARMGRYGR